MQNLKLGTARSLNMSMCGTAIFFKSLSGGDIRSDRIELLAKMNTIANFMKKLLIGLALPLIAGCQTGNEISSNYKGMRFGVTGSSGGVTIVKMHPPFETAKKQWNSLIDSGYTPMGNSFFAGIYNHSDEVKKFAARIGADLVLRDIMPVGEVTKSYMGVESFTPGRTITSFGSASAYSTGTGSGTLFTPSGPVNYSGQSSGNAYGTGMSTTYIPSQTTYAPRYYQVPVARQFYAFWLSPQGYLKNLRREFKKNNIGTEEGMRSFAANFAQAWNVTLPKDLTPFGPVGQLSESEKQEIRKELTKVHNRF